MLPVLEHGSVVLKISHLQNISGVITECLLLKVYLERVILLVVLLINSHLAHLLKAELLLKQQLNIFRILVMKKFRSAISSVMTLKRLFLNLLKTIQLVVMRLQLEQFHQVTYYRFKDYNAHQDPKFPASRPAQYPRW